MRISINSIFCIIMGGAISTIPLQIYRPFGVDLITIDRLFFFISFLLIPFILSRNIKFSNFEIIFLSLILSIVFLSGVSLSASGFLFYFYVLFFLVFLMISLKLPYGNHIIRKSFNFSLFIVLIFSVYQIYYIVILGDFPRNVLLSDIIHTRQSEHVNKILERGGLRYGGEFYRLIFPFGRPQDFSFFISLTCFNCILLRLVNDGFVSKNTYIYLFIALLFNLISGNRSGQLAIFFSISLPIIIIAFRSIMYKRVGKKFLFVFVVVSISIFILFSIFWEYIIENILYRFNGSYAGHFYIRLQALEAFANLSVKEAIFGIGFDNYILYAGENIYPHAHMTILTILIESGLIGFFAFVFLYIFTYFSFISISSVFVSKNNFMYYFVKYGIFIYIFTSNLFYEYGKSFYLFVSIGLIFALAQQVKKIHLKNQSGLAL